MKTILRSFLLLCAASLTLTSRAASSPPTLTVTAPKAGLLESNALFNATGTAKGSGIVTNVVFSLNGSAWASATSTNHWTNWWANLSPAPGTNLFEAYAVDNNNRASTTDKVSFVFVVLEPLTVLISPPVGGTVTPNDNGKSLIVGASYSLTAKANKGFAFSGWTGSQVSTNPTLKVAMGTNLSFTANFVDNTRPVCVILSPAANQRLSSPLITATGRASDNVAVADVNYNLNKTGWNAATLANGTNWTTAGLTLQPGTNTLSAYAVDPTGNLSLTNTIKVVYATSGGLPPAAMAGFNLQLTADDSESLNLSFGTATFAKSVTDANSEAAAGNYTYTVLSTNTAQLDLTDVAPEDKAGNTTTATFTFTNATSGLFTTDSGTNGVFAITASPALVPASLVGVMEQSVDIYSNHLNVAFGEGVFTNTGNQFGTYTFEQFSPTVALVVYTYTNPADAGDVAFLELTFATSTSGQFFYESFDDSGNSLVVDAGSFTNSAGSASGGFAPVSISGFNATVQPNGKPAFNVSFGAGSFAQFSSDTDQGSGVGDYAFTKTGPNTGQLLIENVSPPGNTNTDVVYFTFTSATSAKYADAQGGTPGTVTLKQATSLAPLSVSGRTVDFVEEGKSGNAVLNADGTFKLTTGSKVTTGTYTYAQYSPVGGMLILTGTAGGDAGSIYYVQMQFTSSSGGGNYISEFDDTLTQFGTLTGSFTLH